MKLLVGPIFGYWWFLIIAITALLLFGIFCHSLFKWSISELGLKFATCLIILSAVLYWWVTMAGEQHRYLFPFIMLIMSWLIVPTLFEWMVSLGSRMRYLAIVYCLVPGITIITLLNIKQGKISSEIEKFFGYNLDCGQYQDEVNMGIYLLDASEKNHRPINIYSIGNYRVGAVEMMDWIYSIKNNINPFGKPAYFNMFRVNDWIHPGIKFKQLLSSDYFIIEKSRLEVLTYPVSALKWQDEEVALAQFIKSCGTNKDSGVRLVQGGPVLLYEVVNREDFAAVCKKWVVTLKWGDDFWVRNSYAQGDFDAPGLKALDLHSSQELISTHLSLLPEVDFARKITLLAVWRKLNESQGGKNQSGILTSSDDLITFLFRADQEIPQKYAIFIHLMDKDKKVIFQHDFEIIPDGGVIPAGTIWKSLITISESELSKTYSIGFGAYIPNKDGSFLKSDCKSSDWNGNRVILNLKP